MADSQRTLSRPRGRPRDPGIAIAVLDAAIRVLARDGLDRMSMDSVAAEAGVSKVTLYTRFAGRTELIGAALAHLRVDHRVGAFYADHLAGRAMDDSWDARVVAAVLDGIAG